MALTVCNDRVYQAFYADYRAGKTFFHGHSYTANPTACAAAIEAMKIMKEKNLPYSRKEEMELFHKRLRDFSKYDFIGDIRYLGFVGALDVVKSRKNGEKVSPDVRIGQKIYAHSLKNGVVLRPLGDTIYFMLPLIVTKKQINDIMDRTEKTLLEVMEG
jgi:adenosylmethionine-8-amino-7-oxononanoate aminotransferase